LLLLLEVIEHTPTGEVFTAESFLQTVRRSNRQWWNTDPDETPWVFRGQRDASWPLLPTAWRPNSSLEPIKQKCRQLIANSSVDPIHFNENIRRENTEYYVHLLAETEALLQFALLADRIGIAIPENLLNPDWSPLKKKELSYNPMLMGNHLALLSKVGPLAQHHGIPTRLLDWTFNPLVAAYFAVGRAFRGSGTPTQIALWAYNTERPLDLLTIPLEDPARNSVDDLRVPRNGNEYLRAQEGLFTYVSWHDTIPSMDSLVKKWETYNTIKSGGPLLRKFVLPYQEVDKLLQLLDQEGINRASLMPSLDTVARTVIDRWNY
jgi:FRG domain